MSEHKHKLVLNSEQVRSRAELIVSKLPVDGTVEVVVSPHKRNRSADQNSYYWKILTVIGNELGNTKEEQHEVYKDAFLIGIFVRDDPGYAEMWSAAIGADVKSTKILLREIARLTSTTQCNVKQMSEYIDTITRHAADYGIKLPAQDWR